MWRAVWALILTVPSLGTVTTVALAQPTPARPPGLAGQNISIDCDVFADGVHEVPIIVVTSPAAGATAPPGELTLQGIAVDCHVDVGAGINRVSVYLGSREAGGTHLGDATLKQPNPIPVLPPDQYQNVSGWVFKTNAPLKAGELNDLVLYARSELTNRETPVTLQLRGAGAPTPTPAPTPTAAPAAPSAPAEATVPPTPTAVPLASNVPEEAIIPEGAERMPMPDDDEAPPPADEAPPPPVEEAPVE